MTRICITGAAQSDLHIVADILQRSGLKPARPTGGENPVDLAFWHEHVLAEAADESGEPQQVAKPGRLWEQLASDIFLSNIKSSLWGWADSRSTWLLDFWADFEPRLNFILVCVSPRQMLANVIMTGTETVSVDAVMNAWLAHHQELLRFHHRNPQRSLLVDANDCAAHPQELLARCAAQWKLPLAPAAQAETGEDAEPADVDARGDALAQYIAHQLCQDYPQTASLQHELAATVTRLGEATEDAGAGMLSPDQIIADYRAPRMQSAEAQRAQRLAEELATLTARFDECVADHARQQEEAQSRLTEATQARDDQNKLAAELQGKLDQLGKTLDDTLASNGRQQEAAANKLKEAEQENELLLLQLHQVQEELESIFLKHQAGQQQIDQLTRTNAALSAERNDLAQAKATLDQEKSALIQRRDALQGEVAALTAARDDATRKHAEASAWAGKLMQERDAQAQLAAERQARIDGLAQERDKQAAQVAERQKQIDALTQAKMALDQEKSALIQRRDALQGEVAALTAARDDAARKHADASASAGQLKQERDAQAKLAAERQARIDGLAQERDSQAAQVIERQKQIDALTRARDEQSKLAAELQVKLDQLTKNLNDTVAGNKQQQEAAGHKLKETEQENELLLLQLHQVQEELEHYFLQYQQAQTQQQAAQTRWQRMLQRNPDYCDYESIEVLTTQGNASSWRITGLDAAGRSVQQLEFKTIVEGGIAGFVFPRQSGGTGALTRWPGNAADQDELTIIPVGNSANAPQRLETLLDLAPGDWTLLQTLTRLLDKACEAAAGLKAPADFQPEVLRSGLGKLAQIIEKFPATLRFDRVSLRREQLNPDYEHLWLRIENLAFGGKSWPEFEFRVSCANLQPEQFGKHPKLEFPEASGTAPFAAWFSESYDDFGAKLELRFALPDAMDMQVWQRLAAGDRVFITALVQRLPAILRTLQQARLQLDRPWDNWINLSTEIQRIVALHNSPPPPAQAVPAPPAKAVPEPPAAEPGIKVIWQQPKATKPPSNEAPAAKAVQQPPAKADTTSKAKSAKATAKAPAKAATPAKASKAGK